MEKLGFWPYIIIIALVLISSLRSKDKKKGSGNSGAVNNNANTGSNNPLNLPSFSEDIIGEHTPKHDNTDTPSSVHRQKVKELQKSYKFTAQNEARSRTTMGEISDENVYDQNVTSTNTEDIDWKKAVIASEILNKKY